MAAAGDMVVAAVTWEAAIWEVAASTAEGFIMAGFITAASASRTTTIATSSAATIIRMITPIIITTRAAAWSGPTMVRGASAFTAIGTIDGTGTTGTTGEMRMRD